MVWKSCFSGYYRTYDKERFLESSRACLSTWRKRWRNSDAKAVRSATAILPTSGQHAMDTLNVYGRFHFDVEEAQRRKGLRPLRERAAEFLNNQNCSITIGNPLTV